MTITFKQLADLINSLPEDQQNKDVSIYVNDEMYEMSEFGITTVADILDDGHPVICIDDREVCNSELELKRLWYFRKRD